MEHARQVWDRLGLPSLHPQGPWHGYDLGHWPEEHQQAARLATDGRYLETGAAYARDRIDAVYLDTGQVIPVDPEPDGAGDD
jgi:4-hydroxy-3-polyprenylbenzoate decarboxylase